MKSKLLNDIFYEQLPFLDIATFDLANVPLIRLIRDENQQIGDILINNKAVFHSNLKNEF